MTMQENNYSKYRGKCKEFAEKLAANNPQLTVVRGHYICPIWGEQPHWWCRNQNGGILDPTREQFPSAGLGEYIEYTGHLECAECGEEITEEDAVTYGNYAFCSGDCVCSFVGVDL